MADELTPEEIAAIGRQLGHPKGELGLKVGEKMLESNLTMIQETISLLQLNNGDAVLELGHGNGGHLPHILGLADGLSYTGLEISELMHQEAVKRADTLGYDDRTTFQLYDGLQVPLAEASINKALAVNSIYFWEDPAGLITSVYEALKPMGKFCIAYGQKEMMKQLPFTGENFQLYDNAAMIDLISQTPFQNQGIADLSDEVTSKTGEQVTRQYSIITLQKL